MNVQRSRLAKIVLCGLIVAMAAGFAALGSWQVKRLYWKHDLIKHVKTRVHAIPIPAPGSEDWSRINPTDSEYLHVIVTGKFLQSCSVMVKAVTVLGGGSWIVTPLRQENGKVVLVNQGFVPVDSARGAALSKCHHAFDPDDAVPETVTVTGLLRISEPGGAFLRHNDPVMQRWYSRDVDGIAAAQRLTAVAPYFIDADAATTLKTSSGPDTKSTLPVGGLTVINFADNHLVYAVTWYVLALMSALAGWRLLRAKS